MVQLLKALKADPLHRFLQGLRFAIDQFIGLSLQFIVWQSDRQLTEIRTYINTIRNEWHSFLFHGDSSLSSVARIGIGFPFPTNDETS